MKSFRFGLLVLLSAAIFGFAYWQNPRVSGANQKLKIDSAKILNAEGRGETRLKFLDGETVQTEYSADANLLSALQNSSPTALQTGDFDRDGVADLISGYEGETGGFLTLHHGNELSIFPAGRDAGGEKISPFLAEASLIAIDEKPDFIGVGDFNNDTFADVVTAQNGGAKLNYFKGNGRGGFGEVEKISVGGNITALVSGNLNRDDGTEDLAVAIATENGAKVLIYEGWQGALNNPKIESFDLPKSASILQTVSLDGDAFGDLAIAVENELILLNGRDRKLTHGENIEVPEAVINRQSFDSKIVAMTAGRFTESAKTEIVVLTENGEMFRVTASAVKFFAFKETTSVAKLFTPEGVTLNKARVSANGSTDDLILIDRENRNINIFGNGELLATFEGETIAALPMRLNKDGLDDLVFLSKNKQSPAVAMTAPQAVFTVNSTGNGFDINPGNGVCETAAGNGVCTLQAAIGETNALVGADEIRFNLPGTAPFTIVLDIQFLREIIQTVTIDATTQPGFAGLPIVEINGAATSSSSGLELGGNFSGSLASNSVVRGLVINRFDRAAIDLDGSQAISNARIEGCYLGTDVTGTIASPNGIDGEFNGAIEVRGTGHTIGGTTTAARNVISGNTSNGIRLGSLNATTGTIIRGNFIGTDRTGTVDLGNTRDGIRSGNIGGSGTTVGGTTAGAGNVISGNGGSGIDFNSSTGTFSGLIVEGNFIGTDAAGNVDLGNDNRGVRFNGFSGGSRIGGTTNAARNIISGNGTDGIELRFCDGVNVQGNFIGMRADGTTLLPNERDAMFLTNATQNSIIGGGTPVTGACNAPCNVVGVSANNGSNAVSLINTIPPNAAERVNTPEGGTGGGNGSQIFNILLRKLSQTIIDEYLDLLNDGRTPNDDGDGDGGPNNGQNWTVVNDCTQSFNLEGGDSVICSSTLNSNPNNNFNVDFYLNALDGQTTTSSFLSTSSVTTDSNGNAAFSATFNTAVPTGASIFAVTRRTTTRDTSEDSPPRLIGGSPCTYQVTPTSFTISAAGNTGNSVSIQTQAGCAWTAVSNNPFITNVSPPNGTGNGLVTFNVQGNTGPPPRVGTLTIAGQTVTVNQFGCTYSFSPSTISFSGRFSPPRGRSVQLQTAPTCQWQITQSPNLAIIGPVSGTGTTPIFVDIVGANSGGQTFSTVSVVGVSSASFTIIQNSKNASLDFDNDNKADIATYGTSGNFAENLLSQVNSVPNAIASWRITNSSNGNQSSTPFGLDDDKLVPGDYNGDGKMDFAVFRPSNGTWFIARPTGVPAQNFDAIPFGLSTDIPVPNDYDGDGITDIAVFRPSDGNWWIRRSIDGGVSVLHWGLNGDKPVPGFYDADEKADIAVWRPSDRTWYILNSSDNSARFVQFGLSSDKPVPGDYDGDFLNDIAVFRPSTGEWFILQSSNNTLRGLNWGLATDKLTPADFDGDLKTDVAVWRPSTQTWFILRSSNGVPQITQQGQSGDIPIQSALIPE